jgi:hypothetical protein
MYKRPTALASAPIVFRLEVHRTIPMTREIQEYIFSFNRSDNDARDRRAFQGYCDTWATNYGKVRNGMNYITGEYASASLPKWTNLVCGRNVVCGEEMVSDGSYGIQSGIPVLRVETIDSNNLQPDISYETHPHLVHHCTIITSNIMENGLRQVNPFPQMGGRATEPKLPCLYPLLSDRPVYIPMWMLIKLTPGSAIPNPYNPVWS